MLLLAAMVLFPMGMQAAKRMSEKLVKKAGVVVLFDQNVDGSNSKGNVIFLRLKDKTRPEDWKNSIQELETCMSTGHHSKNLIPINQPIYNNSKFINTNPKHQKQNAIELWMEENGDLVYSIEDTYGYRKYKIVMAVFYKTYADVLAGKPLGEETSMSVAYRYISQMFTIYQ